MSVRSPLLLQGVADLLMDDNATAAVARPGTSLKRPKTSAQGAVSPLCLHAFCPLLLLQRRPMLGHRWRRHSRQHIRGCCWLSLCLGNTQSGQQALADMLHAADKQ